MKKLFTLILAAALCLTALVGCGDNAGTDSNNYDSKTYKVAVVQQLDHSSLNEIRDAIEAELDAALKASGADPTEVEQAHTAVANSLTLLTPADDEACLNEAGFGTIERFYAAFTWRGWVART